MRLFNWLKPKPSIEVKLPSRLTPEAVTGLFTAELSSQGYSEVSIARLQMILFQFINDIGDPHGDDEAVAAVQNWAMSTAKLHGATSPHEALVMLRSGNLTDDEWAKLKDYWTFAWPAL